MDDPKTLQDWEKHQIARWVSIAGVDQMRARDLVARRAIIYEPSAKVVAHFDALWLKRPRPDTIDAP